MNASSSISALNAQANLAAASTRLGRAVVRLSRSTSRMIAGSDDDAATGETAAGHAREANAAEVSATLTRYTVVTRSGLAALAERN